MLEAMRDKLVEEHISTLEQEVEKVIIILGTAKVFLTDTSSIDECAAFVMKFRPLRELSFKVRAQGSERILQERRTVMLFEHIERLCFHLANDVDSMLTVP